jgi:hypothetical protein
MFGAKGCGVSTYRKATIAKRQREMEQKDRVKEREARRNERRSRIQERASLGRSGPEIVPPEVPTFAEDGPRSLAELRALRDDDAAAQDDLDDERRFRDPDEAADAG